MDCRKLDHFVLATCVGAPDRCFESCDHTWKEQVRKGGLPPLAAYHNNIRLHQAGVNRPSLLVLGLGVICTGGTDELAIH